MEDGLELQRIRNEKIVRLMNDGGFPSIPVEVTDADFESLVNKYPVVIVDCWAPWCMPCRMLAPTLDAIAKEYTGKAVVAKLNTDNNEKTAMDFQIMSIPTILYFKAGKLATKSIGVLPKDDIAAKIDKLL
jgi:thioredoxin 1